MLTYTKVVIASETLRRRVDRLVDATCRVAGSVAVIGATAFSEVKPQTFQTPESALVQIVQAIKDKDADTLTSLTDTTRFAWRASGQPNLGFTSFSPKTLQQEYEKAFAKKTAQETEGQNKEWDAPSCIYYANHQVNDSKIGVHFRNFSSADLFKKKYPPNFTVIELDKTNAGYKIVTIFEYTHHEDADDKDLKYDWRKAKACPDPPKPAKRRLVYQTGLTTEIDTSLTAAGSNPIFQDFQNYSRSLGYTGAYQINVTRHDWQVLPDGRYMAGKLSCEDTQEHPMPKAYNLVSLLTALNKQYPQDDYVVLGHSDGGTVALLAMQIIRSNTTFDSNYPLGPHNVHFIIAHSPVGGIARSLLMKIRGLIPGICDFADTPNTNSETIKYLHERWNNQKEELARIKEDVDWWTTERTDQDGNIYRGTVVGLYNISDRVYSPGNLPFSDFFLNYMDLLGRLPKEILTQIVPGAKNKKFHLYDEATINHGVIYTSQEGKEYIGATIGKQRG